MLDPILRLICWDRNNIIPPTMLDNRVEGNLTCCAS